MFLVIKQKKNEKKRLECQINWCDTTHFDCHAQCLKTKRGHKNSAPILEDTRITQMSPNVQIPRDNRELHQQRRRRLQKRHFKSEVALAPPFSRLFHLV